MSVCRSQALVHAPPGRIWELVGDPRRHPEWWPRVVEVRGERFDEGSNYAQITREPRGRVQTTMSVERLERDGQRGSQDSNPDARLWRPDRAKSYSPSWGLSAGGRRTFSAPLTSFASGISG
jgi:Polyketide cyclase / dehydrase and lipid transport